MTLLAVPKGVTVTEEDCTQFELGGVRYWIEGRGREGVALLWHRVVVGGGGVQDIAVVGTPVMPVRSFNIRQKEFLTSSLTVTPLGTAKLVTISGMSL